MKRVLVILLFVGVFGVVFCGVLSAIAIPAFTQYIQRSKAQEAHQRLAELTMRVQAHCAETSTLPTAAGPTPAVPGVNAQSATWDGTWATIGFTPFEPVYYAYSIVPTDATTVALRAQGDLDGDGLRSTYETSCRIVGSACECSPVWSENDLE